jgi:outer membrane protein assembly factor BamB
MGLVQYLRCWRWLNNRSSFLVCASFFSKKEAHGFIDMPYFAARFTPSLLMAIMIAHNPAQSQGAAPIAASSKPPATRPTMKSVWTNKIPLRSSEPVASEYGRHTIVHIEEKSVQALDSNTGKSLWSFDLSPYTLPLPEKLDQYVPPVFAYAPIITPDTVYIAFNQEKFSVLLALDRSTGKMKWRFDPYMAPVHTQWSGQILSPPYLWRDRLIFRTAIGLTAVKTSNGELLWNCCMDPDVTTTGAPSASPTSDKYLYFNSDFGVAYAFDPITGRCIWKTTTDGKVTTSVINVKKINVTVAHCQPLRIKNNLIVADGVGNIYALDSQNGSIRWKIKPGSYTFHLIPYNGAVCAATNKGLFKLEASTGKLLKQYQYGGAILRCTVIKDRAVLTKYPTGWDLFDLRNWKLLMEDTTFSPKINIAVQGNMFFLSGYLGDGDQTTNELRAYRMDDPSQADAKKK